MKAALVLLIIVVMVIGIGNLVGRINYWDDEEDS